MYSHYNIVSSSAALVCSNYIASCTCVKFSDQAACIWPHQLYDTTQCHDASKMAIRASCVLRQSQNSLVFRDSLVLGYALGRQKMEYAKQV